MLYYDSIRAAITTHAAGIPPYRLAKLCQLPDGSRIVSDDHIRDYLNGDKDMTGRKLDRLMAVLGLSIVAKSPPHPGS